MKGPPMNLSRLGVLAGVMLLSLPPAAQAEQFDPFDYVKQLYRLVLEREPSRGEVELWANNIIKGTSPEEVRASFLGSDEFFRKHLRHPFRFINALCLQVYGRQTTDTEYQALAGRLTALNGNRTVLVLEMIQAAARPAPPPPVLRLPAEPIPIATPN